MNIALVIAGGSGTRTGNAVPKQFLTVNDIPIIVYTLMNLEKTEEIDCICVALASGWEAFVQAYVKQYRIDKLTDIVQAGKSRHETIGNGIRHLACKYPDDAKVLVIDANRPMIPKDVFRRVIMATPQGGCALAVTPCNDSMYLSSDQGFVNECVDRSVLFCGQTPECALLSDYSEVYETANTRNFEGPPAALFLRCNKSVRKVDGSAMSFKITTQDDIELFKAIVSCCKIDSYEV